MWHPTLSSIERATDRPQDRPRPATAEQRREDAMSKAGPLGSWTDCYCGMPYPHGWPGQAGGAPHPREAR